MNVTKNELATMTESFDITTTKARLAESEIAIADGLALLRKTVIANNLSRLEPTLDMIQTETKRVEMYARALGEMRSR